MDARSGETKDEDSDMSKVQWEYKVHVAPALRPSVDELNRLGNDGWELVSTVGVGELGAVDEVWYVFKRDASVGGG